MPDRRDVYRTHKPGTKTDAKRYTNAHAYMAEDDASGRRVMFSCTFEVEEGMRVRVPPFGGLVRVLRILPPVARNVARPTLIVTPCKEPEEPFKDAPRVKMRRKAKW